MASLAARDLRASRREAPFAPLPRAWCKAVAPHEQDAVMAQLVACLALTGAAAPQQQQQQQQHAEGGAEGRT